MSAQSILALIPLEAPLTAESSPGAWPYVIGGGVLVLLFASMLVLLGIGKGREHS